MNKRIATTLAAGVLPLAVVAIAAVSAAEDVKPEPVTVRGSVHSIKLPEPKIELPPGPGREAAETYCGVCHSLDYLLIQPPLSKEAWTAGVTKMQKTFSAPIPDDKVPEILNYLMAIRGKPSAAAASAGPAAATSAATPAAPAAATSTSTPAK
jgi:hypothetical protein